jgi:cleavage stimulation factor subunit 3
VLYQRASQQYEDIIKKYTDRDAPDALSLIYIQYMLFTRRAFGIPAAREVFRRARKNPLITHHVYSASALMEFRVSKDPKIARNIFELGLKRFIDTPNFVMKYLEMLEHVNQDNNIRVLFQRALARGAERLTDLQSDEAEESEENQEQVRQTMLDQMEIWNRFMEFEFMCGDIQAVLKLEKRKEDALLEGSEPSLMRVIQRLRYEELWPCSQAELHTAKVGVSSLDKMKSKRGSRSEAVVTKTTVADTSKFVRPNMKQLIPYSSDLDRQGNPLPPYPFSMGQPHMVSLEGSSTHVGDPLYDDVPPVLFELLSSLPSPEAFVQSGGDCVDVDGLVKLIGQCSLPKLEGGSATQMAGNKRKFSEMDSFGGDEFVGVLSHPPPNDVFRQRQAARMGIQL